ncbi:hypothetical protein DESC_720015 [Desulfosarcina cetonica]|nr:hypothetical protein DESC_720015 [Desulfosarcina cetonica]
MPSSATESALPEWAVGTLATGMPFSAAAAISTPSRPEPHCWINRNRSALANVSRVIGHMVGMSISTPARLSMAKRPVAVRWCVGSFSRRLPKIPPQAFSAAANRMFIRFSPSFSGRLGRLSAVADHGQPDHVGDGGYDGAGRYGRHGKRIVAVHLFGHDIGDGGRRRGQEDQARQVCLYRDIQDREADPADRGQQKDFDGHRPHHGPDVFTHDLQRQGGTDEKKRHGWRQAAEDIQKTLQHPRQGDLKQRDQNAGSRRNDDRVMHQLFGDLTDSLAGVGRTQRVCLQRQNGEGVLHDHEKTGQDAGLGQSARAEEIKSHGNTDIAEVAMGGALDEGADATRRPTGEMTDDPGAEIGREGRCQRYQEHGDVEFGNERGLGDGLEDQGRNGQVVNHSVGRFEERRWHESLAAGDESQNHDGENGDDGGKDLHGLTIFLNGN